MKFTNIKKEDDGTSFDVKATDEEVLFLVNHAVGRLLMDGVIAFNIESSEEQEAVLPLEGTIQ
jgi:hypothetical protein